MHLVKLYIYGIGLHLFDGSFAQNMYNDLFFFRQQFARDGLVNIVGGCCGTTPQHIKYVS